MHKHFLYKIFYGIILITSILLASCKSNKSSVSTNKKNSGELSEKSRILLENLYIDGCKERLAGKIEKAEDLFRQCQKIDPSNIAVKYELSNILRLTGRLDEAILLSKECVESDPKNQWFHLAYIDALNHKKLFLQAAQAYERMSELFPGRSDLIESTAIAYALAQNYAKAFKIYEELERKFGTNETFTVNKIKLLKEQRKFTEAESELKKLIDTDPTEARYYYYLAEHYEDLKEYEKAKAVFDKIVTIDPHNPMVHLALANYYKEQNKAELAHSEFKLAFINPDLDVSTKLKILLSYYSISEEYPEYVPKGYELCELMLKVHPMSPEANSMYADFLLRDDKYEQARKYYLVAALYDKNRFAIWEQLMRVETQLNQIDSLERHSAIAIELFPNQPSPYFFNGISNLQLRNYPKAIQSLNDGLEFVYDNKRLMLDFYSNLGDAYNYNKEYEKSDKAFEDALKIDPDNAYVLNNYSYYLSLRKEKLDKAEKLSKRSNEISANNPSYLDTYGWILYQQKKYKEAEEWLALAVKLGSKRADILEHYGDLMYRLNKPEEAIKFWNLAKEAGGQSDALLKKISTKKLNE